MDRGTYNLVRFPYTVHSRVHVKGIQLGLLEV